MDKTGYGLIDCSTDYSGRNTKVMNTAGTAVQGINFQVLYYNNMVPSP